MNSTRVRNRTLTLVYEKTVSCETFSLGFWLLTMIKLALAEGFDVLARRVNQPHDTAEPHTKPLRQRAGEASWRYLLSTMGAFAAFGVLVRCCGAGWLT
jgi:hypothetical protein